MNSATFRRAASRNIRDFALNTVIASPSFPRGLRWRSLRACGLDVQRSTINGSHFIGGRGISIGRDVFLNYGVFLDAAAPIIIGDRVSFGPRVTVLTGSHELGGVQRRAGAIVTQEVHIHDGAWVGAGAIVLPGITIGEGAVVAAGAVVTEDVPPNTMVGGVPARILRRLDDGQIQPDFPTRRHDHNA